MCYNKNKLTYIIIINYANTVCMYIHIFYCDFDPQSEEQLLIFVRYLSLQSFNLIFTQSEVDTKNLELRHSVLSLVSLYCNNSLHNKK